MSRMAHLHEMERLAHQISSAMNGLEPEEGEEVPPNAEPRFAPQVRSLGNPSPEKEDADRF